MAMKKFYFNSYSGVGYTVQADNMALAIKELRKQGVRLEEIKRIVDAAEEGH